MAQMPQRKQTYIALKGGVDQTTPALESQPGTLRDSSNFDINILGGYFRIDGYEKWDGRQNSNTFGFFSCIAALTTSIDVGRTIVGTTSGATGQYLGMATDGQIVYAVPTGTFQVGEEIRVLGSPVGYITTEPYQRIDRSSAESAQWMAKATTAHRAYVQTVPGAGPIRGLQYYEGALYAWRNTADNSQCAIYKSSPTGWQAVSLGTSINFTAGSGSILEGQTLTRGGVTSTILRVVIRSGSTGAGTAAGTLAIGSPTGTYTAGAATTSGGGSLTLSGAQAAITHAPNGRIRAVLSNFGRGLRMYWCSGVDNAFEFDGTVAVKIVTGMTVDQPEFLQIHKNHLFLGFDNSLQHSAVGDPYVWSAVLGAAELNMGDSITNLLPQPSDAQSGGAMVISTRNSIFVLYGSSIADWKLVTFQRDSGSLAHTMQAIAANTYFLDDRGITNLSLAQEFGNFNAGTISSAVRQWLVTRKSQVIDSCVVKEKNQYRLFFGGGTGMHVTFNGANVSGFMPVQYAHNIVVSHSCELSDGMDAVFYGDDSGNVYMADSGPSFSGERITAFMKLQYNNCGSPRLRKRFHKAVFEVGGAGYADFTLGAELGYTNDNVRQQEMAPVDVQFSTSRWDDVSQYWDTGVWDGKILLPIEVPLEGTEENIGLVIYQSSDTYMGLNFQSALLTFTERRSLR